MRQLFFGVVALLTLPLLWGCGPNLSSKDYGTVVEGIPQVQGADKPFEMPKLGPPPPPEDLHSHGEHF